MAVLKGSSRIRYLESISIPLSFELVAPKIDVELSKLFQTCRTLRQLVEIQFVFNRLLTLWRRTKTLFKLCGSLSKRFFLKLPQSIYS